MGRHRGGRGGYGTRPSTRAFPTSYTTPLDAQVPSLIVDPVLTPSLQDSTPHDAQVHSPAVDPVLTPTPQESTPHAAQIPLPASQDPTLQEPIPAAPRPVRGPTTRSVETSQTPGGPKTRAEFFRGRTITQEFTTTVGQWIRSPTTLPYNVKKYNDIHIDFKIALTSWIFFVETDTSKKKKGFIDERSKDIAEKMEELVRVHTNESGVCSLPRQEVLEQVMGPGTKGRERGQGRVAKPPKSKITVADLERAHEEMREEIADQIRQGVQSQVVQAVAEALRLYREGI